jgi:hypothetical protein
MFSTSLLGWCKDRKTMKTLRFYGTQNRGIYFAPLQRKRGTVNSLCYLPKDTVY